MLDIWRTRAMTVTRNHDRLWCAHSLYVLVCKIFTGGGGADVDRTTI